MFILKKLWLDRDKKARAQWADLMERSNLNPNEILDYTVGVYDGDSLAAIGSYESNIIKCVSVCQDYQSDNLLTKIMIHLVEQLREAGHHHYFVYTKPSNRVIFRSLGFKEIIANESVLFMEQGFPDFDDYLKLLKQHQQTGTASAIVMNANPFTKGHQYLTTIASERSDHVYVFVVTEERSEFSNAERLAMVQLGTQHLPNVTVLPTRDYMVSRATFPSYFLRDKAEEQVASVQASLDALLFKHRIAPILNITERFVGEEPYSEVTNIYNQSMQQIFGTDIQLRIIPRLAQDGNIISATKVRQAIQEKKEFLIKEFLPETSYRYLKDHNKL